MPLTITTASENIRVTNDAKLARDQVTNYPDSPEAHFVLAVALTRTSQVEEALKEIRIARKLSTQKGGAAYFDKMIDEYENMLGYYPNDNEVRYHLAWAYYMKAYVLARYSKSVIHGGAANPNQTAVNAKGTTAIVSPGERQWQSEWVQQSAVSKPDSKQSASNGADKSDTKDAADATTGGAAPERTEHGAGVNSDTKLISQDAKIDTSGGAGNGGAGSGGVGSGSSGSAGTFQAERPSADKAPDTVAKATPDNFVLSNPLGKQIANLGPVTAMDYAMTSAAPEVIPQIKSYYERALKKLDEVLEHEPDDLWANLYRAHLRAEYSGDIDAAMTVWQRCQEAHPNSPAPYFFLGEGYLKKGDLRQCLTNVSKAIALRAIGN